MSIVCAHPTISEGAQRKQWDALTHYDVMVIMLVYSATLSYRFVCFHEIQECAQYLLFSCLKKIFGI